MLVKGATSRNITYHKIYNMIRTESQNLMFLVLQLPLPNPLKPGEKSIIKMIVTVYVLVPIIF